MLCLTDVYILHLCPLFRRQQMYSYGALSESTEDISKCTMHILEDSYIVLTFTGRYRLCVQKCTIYTVTVQIHSKF